jgi:hypothetical protein
MIKKRILMLLVVLAVLLPACSKYDDGPLISFTSKGMRVNGTWYFQSMLYGDADSTSRYTYQKLDFYYAKDYDGGAFTWDHDLYAQTLNETIYETGTWKFISNRDSFEMIHYKNQLKDSTSVKWKINRLASNEFWLERHLGDTLKVEMLLVKYGY